MPDRITANLRRVERSGEVAMLAMTMGSWIEELLNNSRRRYEYMQGLNSAATVGKQKVCVSRKGILPVGSKVLNHVTNNKAGAPVLEIEFTGEVGTGTGPTSEWFSLLVEELKQFQRPVLFRNNVPQAFLFPTPIMFDVTNLDFASLDVSPPTTSASNSVVQSLAPTAATDRMQWSLSRGQPSVHQRGAQNSGREVLIMVAPSDIGDDGCTSDESRVLKYFRMLGQLVGKAIIDQRLIELRLHPIFWRLAIAQDPLVCLETDLQQIDPLMASSLEKLCQL
eukprot:Platyproteum_vivax@DN4445_c0_g2_i2.p1